MCPIFDSSQSNSLTRYKILKGCSFGSKNLLNFTCLTMKFHNYHHSTIYYVVALLAVAILSRPRVMDGIAPTLVVSHILKSTVC